MFTPKKVLNSKKIVFFNIVIYMKQTKTIHKLGKDIFCLLLRDFKLQQVVVALQQHEPLKVHGCEGAPLGLQDVRPH